MASFIHPSHPHLVAEAARYTRYLCMILLSSSWGILGRSKAKWDLTSLQHILDLPLGFLQVGLAWIIPTGKHPGGIQIR